MHARDDMTSHVTNSPGASWRCPTGLSPSGMVTFRDSSSRGEGNSQKVPSFFGPPLSDISHTSCPLRNFSTSRASRPRLGPEKERRVPRQASSFPTPRDKGPSPARNKTPPAKEDRSSPLSSGRSLPDRARPRPSSDKTPLAASSLVRGICCGSTLLQRTAAVI